MRGFTEVVMFLALSSYYYVAGKTVPWDEDPSYEELAKARDFINAAVKRDNIVVFSKSYCPYSLKAKALLNDYKVKYMIYEVDQMYDGKAILEHMKKLTGSGTVPRVFVNGNFVGGASDILEMSKAGKLKDVLNGNVLTKKLTG